VEKEANIPIHEKYALSIDEACQYFSIGRDKMYELVKQEGCPYALHNGRTLLVKRKAMEKYLEQMYYI